MDYEASVEHLPSYYQSPHERYRFEPMTRAIHKHRGDKNVTVELCLYGWGNVEQWGPDSPAHLWRTSKDIQ